MSSDASALGRVAFVRLPSMTHLQRDDFGPVALAAPVLRLVLAGSQPTLDVNLAAFAQEPLARIRKRPECDHAMPLIWNDRSTEEFLSLVFLVVFLLEEMKRPKGQTRRLITLIFADRP